MKIQLPIILLLTLLMSIAGINAFAYDALIDEFCSAEPSGLNTLIFFKSERSCVQNGGNVWLFAEKKLLLQSKTIKESINPANKDNYDSKANHRGWKSHLRN